jgi:hypothetical protein
MNAPFLWKRFTDNSVESYVGAANELLIDMRPGFEGMRIGDGVTPGGSLVLSELVSGINLPFLLSPTNEAVDIGTMPILNSSAFIGLDANMDTDSHSHTRWQIASNSNFTTIVFDSDMETTNLTSIDLSLEGVLLTPNTNYYVRLKYKGASGLESGWGPTSMFMTGNGGLGTQTDRFTSSDAVAGDKFGHAVSSNSDGTVIAVGARGDNSGVGSVYVYRKSGNNWVETKINASDESTGWAFGLAVSISGDSNTLVVGAEGNNSYYGGLVYIYKWNGTSWDETKISSKGGGFGRSVSVNYDGTVFIVGSPYDNTFATSSGAARIYTWTNGSWYDGASSPLLVRPINSVNTQFGMSVAISGNGNTASFGAYGKNSFAGSVYVTRRSGSSWSTLKEHFASDGAGSHRFGFSISISYDGTVIAVGAYGHTVPAVNSGAMYVIKYLGGSWTSSGSWSQSKLSTSNMTMHDVLGYSVSLSSDATIIAVAARGSDIHINNGGALYLYTLDEGVWYETVPDIYGAVDSGYIGSVAISGDGATVLAGELGTVGEGHIYIFN